jgi:hypothetical protein
MTIEATTWLYVAILKSGNTERIVGQTDSEHDIDFIPAFLNKEDAQQGMFHMHLERKGKGKYEIQAIIYEDLARHALDNGFVIFVLDGEGKIVERLPGSA